MTSKIPRLCLTPEAVKTDDEKLEDKYKGARSKKTMLKSSVNGKARENCEATKMKNLNEANKTLKNKTGLSSGTMKVSKTVNKISKTAADTPKKENVNKRSVSVHVNIRTLKLSDAKISYGSEKENPQKPNEAKPETGNKSESKVTKTKKLDEPSEFARLTFAPKKRQSFKPTFELSKSMRRSKTESDLKTDMSTKNGKDKITKQTVHENKSKTVNQRNFELSHILSPEFRYSMEEEIAQKESFSSKKDTAHGGLSFKPNIRKKKSSFNFNINKT